MILNGLTWMLNRMHIPWFRVNMVPTDSIILTIDDGPTVHTGDLMQWLHQEGIPAIHFWSGKAYSQSSGKIEIPSSQSIGIHGFHHIRYSGLTLAFIEEELNLIHRSGLLQEQQTVPIIRPPYGSYKPGMHAIFRKNGLSPLYWGWLFPDWTPEFIPESIGGSANQWCRPGMIITLHDKEQYPDRLIQSINLIKNEMASRQISFGRIGGT